MVFTYLTHHLAIHHFSWNRIKIIDIWREKNRFKYACKIHKTVSCSVCPDTRRTFLLRTFGFRRFCFPVAILFHPFCLTSLISLHPENCINYYEQPWKRQSNNKNKHPFLSHSDSDSWPVAVGVSGVTYRDGLGMFDTKAHSISTRTRLPNWQWPFANMAASARGSVTMSQTTQIFVVRK